ncbi:MAG: hypothetical protein ACFFFB_18460 [Candidatus Heimdallarchaeota archaeon]
MEHKKVVKFLKIVGLIFMIVSYIEISFHISLNFIEFNYIDFAPVLFSDIIYGSNYISLAGTVLWLFMIFSMICYFIVGFFLFKVTRKNKIETKSLAKFVVIIGMVVLMGALVKMNYLVLIGRTGITTYYGRVSIQFAFYDFDISSIAPGIFWIFFISANCAYLISGVVITGIGVKWTLLIEEAEKMNNKNS